MMEKIDAWTMFDLNYSKLSYLQLLLIHALKKSLLYFRVSFKMFLIRFFYSLINEVDNVYENNYPLSFDIK